jgi:hypothetical protein
MKSPKYVGMLFNSMNIYLVDLRFLRKIDQKCTLAAINLETPA